MAPDSQVSPFLSVPREIRDHIYTILLCSFEALPQDVNSFEKPIDRSSREIDVSILRTNRQIYHEAYGLMVLKNKFIHVESAIPRFWLADYLCSAVVPVVMVNTSHADQFTGASLKVIIYMADKEDVRVRSKDSQSVLLLGRDDRSIEALYKFLSCEFLSGYFSHVSLGLNFVTTFILGRRITTNPIIRDDFFSDDYQRLLLEPLRSRLRGMECVKFIGISEDLMRATKKDITTKVVTTVESLLNEVIAAKKEGGLRFKEGAHQAALVYWNDAIWKATLIRKNEALWKRLVSQGDQAFTSSLAELIYLMHLNIAHIQLLRMQATERDSPAWNKASRLAGEALEKAVNLWEHNPPASDFKWDPPPLTKAKLDYRAALYTRLLGNPDDVFEAWNFIMWAADNAPNDVAIAKEAKRIQEWAAMVHEGRAP